MRSGDPRELTQERDLRIVADVVRYGLTVKPVVHRQYFADATDDAARKVLERLADYGWLVAFDLVGKEKFYRLTPAAARRLNLHRREGRPIGFTTLVRNLGELLLAEKLGVVKLTAAEWRLAYPHLTSPRFSSDGHFVDQSGAAPTVGLLTVDPGDALRQVVTKLRRASSSRYAIPGFVKLIQAGRFSVALATPTEGKRRLIEAAVQSQLKGKTHFRVEVVPELTTLLLKGSIR